MAKKKMQAPSASEPTEPEATARDIMTTALFTLDENETVESALKALIRHRITGLPVVNSRQQMVGVLSEYDLIRQISSHPELEAGIFQERIQYSKNAFSIAETTPLPEIVRHFIDAKFRRVTVVDADGRLSGIITRRDLMRVFYYRANLT